MRSPYDTAINMAVAATRDQREQGWLLEQKAAYLDHVDPAGAQQVLAAARQKNPEVLRPLSGVTYHRLSASTDQARQAAEYLSDTYRTAADLRLGVQAIADELIFDPDGVEAFEEALRLLACHLGLGAQRPEKEISAGPDALWALGGLLFWVIEAKSGATSGVIHKRDTNQLGGSIRWFQQRYDRSAKVIPVMVHGASQMAPDATAIPGMQILTREELDRLREAFIAYGTGLAATQWHTGLEVNPQLLGHRLRSADLASYVRPARAAS